MTDRDIVLLAGFVVIPLCVAALVGMIRGWFNTRFPHKACSVLWTGQYPQEKGMTLKREELDAYLEINFSRTPILIYEEGGKKWVLYT